VLQKEVAYFFHLDPLFKGPLTWGYFFYNVSWVALIMFVFFKIKNSHNLEIKGIFPSLILASDLHALFEKGRVSCGIQCNRPLL